MQKFALSALAAALVFVQGCTMTQEPTAPTAAVDAVDTVDAVSGATPVPMAPTEAQKQFMGYTEGATVLSGIKPSIATIEARSGVIYSQHATPNQLVQLKMHLLIPKSAEPKPAIIFFPGGFVVATAEYRVVPNQFPALLEDGKAAVRYLRYHAKDLGIDPNRIGVLGDSAGGYMAQIVGTTNGETKYDQGDYTEVSSDVQAACSIYGISDLLNIGEGYSEDIVAVHHSPAVTEALLVNGPAFNTFPGASIDADLKRAQEASAINHVDKNDPPMLLLHGSADTLVSPWQSAHMFEKMKSAGVDVNYVMVEGAPHGGELWHQFPVVKVVAEFFKDKLSTAETAK